MLKDTYILTILLRIAWVFISNSIANFMLVYFVKNIKLFQISDFINTSISSYKLCQKLANRIYKAI